MKYRKKPVEIDALQWTGKNLEECKAFLGVSYLLHSAERHPDGRSEISIKTLEGKHIASRYDYLIRGVKGEHYPCRPDIFAMTYEPVVDEWEPKGLTQILADALLAVHSGASLCGIESRLSRLEKMGLVVYSKPKWRLTVRGAAVANKLAEDDPLYTTPQPGAKHCACEWSASGKLEQECIGHKNHRLSQAPQPVVDSRCMNPRLWTKEMSYAWCSNIPDLQKAFDALLSAGKETV